MFKELNILKLFLKDPDREYNVREVARLTKVVPATASSQLKVLEKKGMILQRKERMLKLFKAYTENQKFRDLKLYYTISQIRVSGLINALDYFYLRPAIVLFGSTSRGEDREMSDIDLLVISEKTSEFPYRKEYEKKLGKSVQLFVFSDIKQIKNKHLLNNMLNGIPLQGRIQWI